MPMAKPEMEFTDTASAFPGNRYRRAGWASRKRS